MNREAFCNSMRAHLGRLRQSQVDGTNTILDIIEGEPLAWRAYMLATAWHETARTMKPIKERGGVEYFTRLYDVAGVRAKLCISMGNTCAGDGPKHCGRGYVQLTWKANYAKADAACAAAGLIQPGALLADPDLAMDPPIAAHIMLQGMKQGWFTGKKLSDYLPGNGNTATRSQYVAARRIINGTDKADLIEDYAQHFERCLRVGDAK